MTGDDKNIKVLFFGDLVGRPGRFAVRDFLMPDDPQALPQAAGEKYDFIIANVENASHGFGLTEKS